MTWTDYTNTHKAKLNSTITDTGERKQTHRRSEWQRQHEHQKNQKDKEEAGTPGGSRSRSSGPAQWSWVNTEWTTWTILFVIVLTDWEWNQWRMVPATRPEVFKVNTTNWKLEHKDDFSVWIWRPYWKQTMWNQQGGYSKGRGPASWLLVLTIEHWDWHNPCILGAERIRWNIMFKEINKYCMKENFSLGFCRSLAAP